MVRNFQDVKHGKKVIDTGLILGERKYRWELKKKYKPVWAITGSEYISELSPHKRDFTVYIPKGSIKEGDEITICNTGKFIKIKIDNIHSHCMDFTVLKKW
ncbi:MAG: hypothetical protein H8D23_18805 [Candidatus Brocadiales bacterium]|nr:hypothetical protein [Candidatus Brocadiales bacterium]